MCVGRIGGQEHGSSGRTLRSSTGPRRRGAPKPMRGRADPRVLTAKISRAESAAALLDLVDKEVDDSLNEFHLSAAFSRLAKFSQRRQLSPKLGCC